MVVTAVNVVGAQVVVAGVDGVVVGEGVVAGVDAAATEVNCEVVGIALSDVSHA